MALVPKHTLEEIRLGNPIEEVVGSYFNIQRSGSTFKALCPFHKEKTPSFHVNPQRQIFHCFGCDVGGDVFKFVMMIEGVDFMNAVRILARRAGVRIEFEERGASRGFDKEVLYAIHEKLARDYHRTLLQSPEAEAARAYLRERELGAETVAEFVLGYAPDRWDAAVTWAGKNGYSLKQMETAGLVLRSERQTAGAGYYDRFRDRLVFPIRDELSRVIGFSGRILHADQQAAKYVNSPETPLFRKGRVLYALDKARKSIVDTRQAVVCEGQIDVIRCHQAGVHTAVAPQGTATTEDHARTLKRYADNVVLVFDADKAGQDAAVRAADVLLGAGLAVRIARLPDSEDPDSFLRRNGPEAFHALIDKAGSALDFQIDVLTTREDIQSEVGRMRIARAALETIARSPDIVQQEQLLDRLCRRLNLPLDRIRDIRRMLRQGPARPAARRPDPAVSASPGKPAPREELAITEQVVSNPAMAALVERYLPLEMISDTSCRTLLRCVLETARTGEELATALDEIDDEQRSLSAFAAKLQMSPEKVRGDEFSQDDAVKDLILRIRRRRLERRYREIGEQLRDAPDDRKQDLRDERHHIAVDRRLLDKWETALPLLEAEEEADPGQSAVDHPPAGAEENPPC
ncbi:MAG: DNA primase [Kiritimatiellae bacterium]|nr:DNA primase [Kiritimatiellia bacterium]